MCRVWGGQMIKKNEHRRKQPELFFVLSSDGGSQSISLPAVSGLCEADKKSLSPEVAKSHRDRLIEELREFGY